MKFNVGDRVRAYPHGIMKGYSKHGVGIILAKDLSEDNLYPYTIRFNCVGHDDTNYFTDDEIYRDNKYIKKHGFTSRG